MKNQFCGTYHVNLVFSERLLRGLLWGLLWIPLMCQLTFRMFATCLLYGFKYQECFRGFLTECAKIDDTSVKTCYAVHYATIENRPNSTWTQCEKHCKHNWQRVRESCSVVRLAADEERLEGQAICSGTSYLSTRMQDDSAKLRLQRFFSNIFQILFTF